MDFNNNNEVKLIENLVWSFFKWILIALLTGFIGGVIGSIFNLAVRYATGFRELNPWLIWLLPAGGALIALMYSVSKMEHENTDSIIDSIREGTRAPILLTPCIFIATLITHICGGSAGREGAALQIGGSIGANVAALLHLDDKDLRLATLCGMSAVFSALFGTPVTAAIFALEFISVGIFYYSGLIPCLVSAITAFGINKLFHIPATHFQVPLESLSLDMLWRVAILAVFCAVISTAFCFSVQYFASVARRRCPNTYLRAVIGGVIIIGLTYLVGCTDYNGTGQTQLMNALESGVAKPSAFFWKILFTAVTLGCGFRGGEIIPTFFIGATFGCVVGPLLGIPAQFAASIGLISVFCGAVNCPIASIVLAIELFQSDFAIVYFALACGISYMLSGYYGLYQSQKIMYSKTRAEYINIKAK